MTLDLGIDVTESKSGRWFKYFTSWAYIVCVLYFLFSFFLTFMELCQICRRNLHTKRPTKADPNDVEMAPAEGRFRHRDFDDVYEDPREPANFSNRNTTNKNSSNNTKPYYDSKQQVFYEDEPLPFQFKLMWVLENIAITISASVTIAYWTIIRDHNKSLEPNLDSYLVVDRHGIVFLFMLLDFLFNRMPFRALHFIYPLAFGLLYLAFHLANWEITGEVIYSDVLNWDEHPGHTLAYFTGMFIGIIIIHFLMSIIHRCKTCK